jgi:tRNA/rRNA methyltransferase
MPGAGTDRTKDWSADRAPIVVLVEPQLGENIGAAARAMANFGLSQLRLVNPRQGWPNDKARMMATGAGRVVDAAALYPNLAEAIADCSFVLATTARAHDQAKQVVGPAEAAALMGPRSYSGANATALRTMKWRLPMPS